MSASEVHAPGSAGRLARAIGSRYRLAALTLIVIAFFGATAPGFLSRPTWIAVTTYIPEILLLALGETVVVITAGIDLSVGGVLDFSGMASGIAMQAAVLHHEPAAVTIALGALVALASGVGWGLVNGWIITRTRVTPFIVTLGTLGMATGGAYLFTNNGSSVSTIPAQLGQWTNTSILGWVPVLFLIGLLASALIGWLLSRTRFGVRTYAIGSNMKSAVVAGINVRRHLLWVYVLSGLIAGADGFLVTARFVTASPLAGADDLLSAIAAVVIGGASLFGGKGTITGTFLGSVIIGVLLSGLILLGLESYWQTVATGLVIVLVVGADEYQHRERSDL